MADISQYVLHLSLVALVCPAKYSTLTTNADQIEIRYRATNDSNEVILTLLLLYNVQYSMRSVFRFRVMKLSKTQLNGLKHAARKVCFAPRYRIKQNRHEKDRKAKK